MGCRSVWCVLLCAVAVGTHVNVDGSKYHSVVEHVIYNYPGQVQGDWELRECGPKSVCSVIRRRFWLPAVIHRLCRCVSGSECPWTWAGPNNPFSMPLDNRSQLKFCEQVTELEQCGARQTGISVRERREGGSVEQTTQAYCLCHWPAYWQLHRHYYRNYLNGTVVAHNHYKCAKLTKCGWYDFCGHVVPETYSTYYRCSCPVGSLCIHQDKTLHNATELLYRGPTFRAYCVPF